MVLVDGHDVNLERVCAGMAWWYRQYAKEQAPADRQLYDLAENEARAAKRGLWADPQPAPSWEWRRKGRDARSLAMTALPTPAVLHPLLVEADASPGYVDEMALADKLTAALLLCHLRTVSVSRNDAAPWPRSKRYGSRDLMLRRRGRLTVIAPLDNVLRHVRKRMRHVKVALTLFTRMPPSTYSVR